MHIAIHTIIQDLGDWAMVHLDNLQWEKFCKKSPIQLPVDKLSNSLE
jgi:hypothetical protein